MNKDDPAFKKLLEDTIAENDRLKAENMRLRAVVASVAKLVSLVEATDE